MCLSLPAPALNPPPRVCRDNCNCEVRRRMQGGDQRLAIYTTKAIPPGEELTYSYGDGFFWQDAEGGMEDGPAAEGKA